MTKEHKNTDSNKQNSDVGMRSPTESHIVIWSVWHVPADYEQPPRHRRYTPALQRTLLAQPIPKCNQSHAMCSITLIKGWKRHHPHPTMSDCRVGRGKVRWQDPGRTRRSVSHTHLDI